MRLSWDYGAGILSGRNDTSKSYMAVWGMANKPQVITALCGKRKKGGIIDYQCQEWDQISSSVNFSISIDIDRIKRCLPITARILDYGCGYGRISRLLKDAGYISIVGYDTSFRMIERGRSDNPDLDLRHNKTYELPEPSESFDAAIVTAVFTSLPDESLREIVLREMNRVINKDGVLILSEFLRDDQRSYDVNGCFVSKIGIKMKHFYESEISSMLHGWDIIHFERVTAESIDRSIVPAVHVIAHSSPEGDAGRSFNIKNKP